MSAQPPPQEASAAVLQVDAIAKYYGGVHALDGVSLELFPGEVHCLAGENGSGKSTLIKIMSGVERPTSGVLRLAGRELSHLTPTEAVGLGIDVIFQDLALFKTLTVAENIALPAALSRRQAMVDRRRMRQVAEQVTSTLNVDLDLDARVEELSVADRQLTAICRSMARSAQVVFMDEPTTALTHREVEFLFRAVDELTSRGVAVVFVSHKLDEVRAVCQRITILRNGKVVAAGAMADFDSARISAAMTGRDLAAIAPADPPAQGTAPLIQVDGLGLDQTFADVSFSVRPGEVLGITGLLGSGQTEIAEALFGLQPADSGRIQVDGQEVRIASVADALRLGIGYVPGDRLSQGLFLEQSISDNLVVGSVAEATGRVGLLDRRRIRDLETRSIQELAIKTPSASRPVLSLSGGNQQRVVIARWLARNPRLLILNSPTVGVDVGSKAGILQILRDRAEAGMGVIIISDDPTEVVAVCHRVIFVRHGRLDGELRAPEITEESITRRLAA
ncbi:MAG: sugar ABC transporter ATP-binding protein [Propionicimonas sp.]|uniref:sugar ABC transporter ATP-binding protein n=1 Tax=Propionicimonas sp. TaxID=1955623 RepID=UPI002B20F267|nr:sugar ABC transporter ATP-binding protein [Propionicimonas sp.]MEA4945053.1 sugar ABC transporter ATP-binding protein [Propionicimonas sp.]MEA5116705.1 sugar ABC transporter ATP-binding protein [Propionicimonas sp.]